MEYLGIIIDIISLLFVAFGIIIGLKRLRLFEKQYKDNFEWEIRLNSLKYSGLYHPKIRESKEVMNKEFNLYKRKDSIPEADIVDKINNNPDIQIHINNILTYYENMCLACRQKIADERIIYDMCGVTMYNMRHKLINYINYHRSTGNNPRLWKEFDCFSRYLYSTYFEPKEEVTNELGK